MSEDHEAWKAGFLKQVEQALAANDFKKKEWYGEQTEEETAELNKPENQLIEEVHIKPGEDPLQGLDNFDYSDKPEEEDAVVIKKVLQAASVQGKKE